METPSGEMALTTLWDSWLLKCVSSSSAIFCRNCASNSCFASKAFSSSASRLRKRSGIVFKFSSSGRAMLATCSRAASLGCSTNFAAPAAKVFPCAEADTFCQCVDRIVKGIFGVALHDKWHLCTGHNGLANTQAAYILEPQLQS